jgi:hypothetical protein
MLQFLETPLWTLQYLQQLFLELTLEYLQEFFHFSPGHLEVSIVECIEAGVV